VADGKARVSRRIRESEDLLERRALPSWTEASQKILRVKKGCPRIDIIGPGIFFLRTRKNILTIIKGERGEKLGY